jgi:MoxR-like ATPase
MLSLLEENQVNLEKYKELLEGNPMFIATVFEREREREREE